jgi:hypothetical protein
MYGISSLDSSLVLQRVHMCLDAIKGQALKAHEGMEVLIRSQQHPMEYISKRKIHFDYAML